MIVVLQLERLGDLVQSLPALTLSAKHRERVLLVVREELEEWARVLVPKSIEIRSVRQADLLELAAAVESKDEASAMKCAARALDGLNLEQAEQVINFTWHRLGAWLSRASGVEKVCGARISDLGEQMIRGWWPLYPLAAVDALPGGRVQMSDVRRLMIGEALGLALPECADPKPAHDAGQEPKRGLYVMVGAGDPSRLLRAECLAMIVRAAAQWQEPIALIGGPGERLLAREIIDRAGVEITNLVGRVDPQGLVDRLRTARLVIGADTGPVHLAAWLGTPVMMWMTGRAHVWETGPSGSGHVVVQGLPVGACESKSIGEADLIQALALAMDATQESRRQVGAERFDLALYISEVAADPLGGTIFRSPVACSAQDDLASREMLARFLSCDDASSLRHHDRCAALGAIGDAWRLVSALRSDLAQGAMTGVAEGLESFATSWRQVHRDLDSNARTRLLGAMIRVAEQHIESPEPARVIDAYYEIVRRLMSALGTGCDATEARRPQLSRANPV